MAKPCWLVIVIPPPLTPTLKDQQIQQSEVLAVQRIHMEENIVLASASETLPRLMVQMIL